MECTRLSGVFLALALWASASLCAACQQSSRDPLASSSPADSTGNSPLTDPTESAAPSDPTVAVDAGNGPFYWGGVEPLLVRECVVCHQEGGVGPFALTSLEQARTWGPLMAAETAARRMPPFTFDNSGVCGEFHNARWLDEEDIQLLADWLAVGMPEGEPGEVSPAPVLSSLGDAQVLEVATPSGYMPVAEGRADALLDDYQCFLVDIPGDEGTYVTGYEVVPGDPRVVHHLLAFVVDPGLQAAPPFSNQFFIDTLDNESPDRPGWDCFGGAGDNVLISGVPVAWAPGTGVTIFPEGTGLRVEPHERLVLQLHYNLANVDDSFEAPPPTVLRLQVKDSVERVAQSSLDDGFLSTVYRAGPVARLEAGVAEASYRWSADLVDGYFPADHGGEDMQVLGVLSHMHRRGRRMRVEFETADGVRCGSQVSDWDFDWQMMGWLKQPITLRAGDRVHATCTWDTRDDLAPVQPGFGTESEMCLLGLYVAPAP